jgi:hypothetical protein
MILNDDDEFVYLKWEIRNFIIVNILRKIFIIEYSKI